MFPIFSKKKKNQRKVNFDSNFFFIPSQIKLDIGKRDEDALKIKEGNKPNLCPFLVI